MKIFVATDHRGFNMKEELLVFLRNEGYDVEDVGNTVFDADDDFTFFAKKAALEVLGSDDKDARAIMLCGGGQGMCMMANRFKGVRAAVIWDATEAKITRADNDSNILCLPARVMDGNEPLWQDIVITWLTTEFDGAVRHVRRNRQLDEI